MTVTPSVRVVGTRVPGSPNVSGVLDALRDSDASSVAIASAYWDAKSLERAGEAAAAVGGTARVLLWTAGTSRSGWEAAQKQHTNPVLDVRFVDPPEDGGIFHAKLAGVERSDGTWSGAVVGSANLTDAALRKNVELGVLIRDDPAALGTLKAWFDDAFAHAVPAKDIDFAKAIRITPETSEAANRAKTFREAKLAVPARAGEVLPPFETTAVPTAATPADAPAVTTPAAPVPPPDPA